MKKFIIAVLAKVYDKNPISYGILRKLYRGEVAGIACIMIIPFIPIWNYMAVKEIEKIRNNGNIFCLAKRNIKFYLPELDIHCGEFIQNRIFLERDYFEIFHLKQLKGNIKKSAVILDIGANIGNHTIFFAKECGASKIYAFEPTQKTFQTLVKNIEINQLDRKVVAMNVALGSKDSKVKVIVNEEDAGSNYVVENVNGDTTMHTLDGMTFNEHIDFVKIDVEGYEFEVLKGAVKTIKRDNPDIFVEIFDENYERVNSLLLQMDYECVLKIEQDYLYRSITKKG